MRRVVDRQQSFSHWEIKIKPNANADSVAYKLVQVLPAGKFNVNTARRYNRQMFDWLSLLDTNVVIILFLMILVACINMSTTLLIMITERTQMVGTFKALGATNKKISAVFLYQGIFIASLGLLLGNAVGYGFCYLQSKFQLIRLDEETYYVDHVLIDVEWWHALGINIGTLVICGLFLLIPSLLINKLSPLKSIKFQ